MQSKFQMLIENADKEDFAKTQWKFPSPLHTPYTWVVCVCVLARGYRNVYTLSGKHFMNSFAQQRGKLLLRLKVGTCVGRTQTGRNEEMS